MFVEALYSLLTSDQGVRSALNLPRADGDTGVFSNIAEKTPLMPYVVYTQVHRAANIVYGGVNPTTELRFQLAVFAASYKAAKLTANAVKAALDGFQGAPGDPDNVYIGTVIPESEHDEVETEMKATTYGVVLDYTFIVYSPR